MELWPPRSFSSRLSSAYPGTPRGRMVKVGKTALTPHRIWDFGSTRLEDAEAIVAKAPWTKLACPPSHVGGQQVDIVFIIMSTNIQRVIPNPHILE